DALAAAIPIEESRVAAIDLTAEGWIWNYDEVADATNRNINDFATNPIPPTPDPADPVSKTRLAPPGFSVPTGSFEFEEFETLQVTLTNPGENPTNSTIMYSIDGGSWATYTGPIDISPDQQISSFVATSDDDLYYSSGVVTNLYGLDLTNFAGTSSGTFRDAVGAENIVALYSQEGNTSRFEWGESYDTDLFETGSVLTFTGADFTDVSPDDRFKLGTLDYYNSGIWLDTGASDVWLDVDIAFSNPSIEESFAFKFALENTDNLETNTADESADFVRIGDLTTEFSTMLNGQRYSLALQFGYLGDQGFATVDQFHVHEGATATADIWGQFVLDGSSGDDTLDPWF
ncbi:MAG: choice-of-anchor K domain-containing protein, partial [Verrucomicrobiota bacterium]